MYTDTENYANMLIDKSLFTQLTVVGYTCMS